ncbi:unnamed protein product [Rotaria magnacalcarata]|uniref:Acetylserotonin O-methyltransferase n=2 Tax=Rotaria magnacalcarata TaxID=392030 RepID=A0A820HY12_9BILA|nr:unnamed protein product [Rotaria magnacalcarata]CAF4215404.1 unnamed protein product [Rotaria magnacalcarata]CAF4299931.1 unnamed protein product [Rotaria magnacalcarata]
MANHLLSIDGLPKFYSIIYHHFVEMSIIAFADLGLADLLVEETSPSGHTAEEIADKNNWNSDLIHRILRSCSDVGIVEQIGDDRHFVLTKSGKFLTSDHPSKTRDFLRFSLGSWARSVGSAVPQIVRNGPERNSNDIYHLTDGVNLYDWLARPEHKEELNVFSGAMTALSLQGLDVVVAGVDFSHFRFIVDCGGCGGTFLAHILENNPNVEQGIVFDMPHTIKQATNHEFEIRKIESSRYKFVAGDLLDPTTIPPKADAYIIKDVLESFDDEKTISAFLSVRQACEGKANVAVFIVEAIILPDDGTRNNWCANGLDIFLAASFNGKVRTVDEYKRLLNAAGLEFVKVHPINAPASIIEACVNPIRQT